MNEIFEELRSAIHSIWHRRWLALAVAWGVCLLGWMAIAMIPNSYESRARIYIQLDDVLAQQIGIPGTSKQDIERVRQTLTSSVNLEKVIRSTKLGEGVTTQRDLDGAIGGLAKAVTVTSTEDNLFVLTAKIGKGNLSDADNAKLAQVVVQKMIDIFREENIAGNRGEVQDSLVFLDQQLEQRKSELEAAEARRVAFEAEHPELIGGADGIGTRLVASRSELTGVEADLAAAQSSLAAINGQLAGTPRTLVTPGDAGGARGALMQARSQLASLQARGLTDEHPDVVALKRQIALLEKQASGEPAGAGGTPNPAYSSLLAIKADREAKVESLQARRAALQSDIMSMAANQASEPAVAAEASRISRDYDVLKKKYEDLLQNREDMRLRGQVENDNSSVKFEVIDPPTTPRQPSAPNRPLLLLGVLIAGLGAGAGAAFAIGHLRSTFATTSALEKALGLPVIGSISQTFSDAERAVRSRRLRMFMAASAALGGVFVLLLAVEFIQRGMVA
ncbi:MAG: chain-length determining protein [Sphingomonadales bacterium]|nr:chain-length determining protein [Sphingomonadales bacterium]MBD3774591.1 chain-length determining protein [Paracoccaceae bacterium]